MYILGINSAYHESSACLIKDGVIVTMAEEERFNRIKHGKACLIDNPDELPFLSINFCLKQAAIRFDQIDYIGFSIDPEGRLKNKDFKDITIAGSWGSVEGETIFYNKLKGIPKILEDKYKVNLDGKFKFIEHHLCHAGSAFYVSPFEESAILVVDGIGETQTSSIYYGNKNKIEKKFESFYPNSLGFLWEKICEYLGFSCYDACKVMGMAAYGNSIGPNINGIVGIEKESICKIHNEITKFRVPDMKSLEEELGPARKMDEPIEHKHYTLALSLQEYTEEIIVGLAKKAKELTKSKNICMSGGVILNCVANSEMMSRKMFDSIYIQPATHDAGTAIGAAFHIWNQILEKDRSYVMSNPFLGPSYQDIDCAEIAFHNGYTVYSSADICKSVAKLISEGNIVGWFQGAMEVGPRALGNRSLLADPRNPKMREILNQKVKHREDFRPFAPSVLYEKVGEWFEDNYNSLSTDFMLFTNRCKENKKHLIPAVLHHDGTARIQTVRETINPLYHRLISEFDKLTGVPMVLNTSFNDSEPIVCSPQDAINTFTKTKIDYLVMGSYLFKRNLVQPIKLTI